MLSHYKFPATLVYSADSGEEQELCGGRVIAQYAVDHQWNVEADLNNDMVGNDHGGAGRYDGTKTNETLRQAAYRRFHGGGVDSPSRNIARYMAVLAEQYLDDFQVRMIYRTDRWGRGGDQLPFLKQGYPAVRLSESYEDYGGVRGQSGRPGKSGRVSGSCRKFCAFACTRLWWRTHQ